MQVHLAVEVVSSSVIFVAARISLGAVGVPGTAEYFQELSSLPDIVCKQRGGAKRGNSLGDSAVGSAQWMRPEMNENVCTYIKCANMFYMHVLEDFDMEFTLFI